MRRRRIIAGLLLTLVAPLAAEAQQAGKVYRVGVLWLNSLHADSHLLEAFRQGLREFVGTEERNIVIEFRSAEGNPEKLPGLVAELVRLKAEVILVGLMK
jgi:putative tryptophan/tyrosine transport system substrate-binding protein